MTAPATQGHDLSPNRYKEVVHAEVTHRPPRELLSELAKLESDIQEGITELSRILG